MRNIILSIFFFLLADNCFSQQILIKIIMEYRSTDSYGVETILAGYGVEMYYVLGSVDEFKENISEISKFTERDILATFKHPLVEPGFSFGHCDTLDNLQKSNSDFFNRNRSIFIKRNGLQVSILISYASVEYCEFYSPYKLWNYDVDFKKAAVITDYKKCRKKVPKQIINDIQNLFDNIPD